MHEPEFTMGDVFAEISEQFGIVQEEHDGNTEHFYTSAEWADMLGISVRRVRMILAWFKKVGRLEKSNKNVETLAGYTKSTPSYRVKPKE